MSFAPISQTMVVYIDGVPGYPTDPVEVPTGAVTQPTLNTLTLSDSLQIGVATSGSILGATAGSTIVSNIPGITVNSGLRTYSGTPTATGSGFVETLSGATGSPKTSAIAVAAPPVTATVDNTLANSTVNGSSVSGFAALVNLLDARLTAAGV